MSKIIEVKGLEKSYGRNQVLRGIDLSYEEGQVIGLLGPNGCGKSTLMKLINSMLTPTEGKLTLGYNIKIGYYDQENRGLSDSNTVFEELRLEYPDKTDLELRSTLALFLFDAEDIARQVSTLSGGERARLTLAKLILKKVNLLVMDEPTNHLDIGSCEALESALLAFDGTIIAVSHDRYFINKIANRIIELDPTKENGMLDYPLESYDDAFNEYMARREARMVERAAEKTVTVSDAKADFEERKREKAQKRSEERQRAKAEEKIKALEGELERLDEELFGSAASDYVRAAEIDKRKCEIEEELLELYEIVM